MATRTVPAPGEAALPAPSAAALMRRNAHDPALAARPFLRFGDRAVTHEEFFRESCRWANLLLARGPVGAERPCHIGVLLDNTPDYLFAFGGAALAGAVVVGLNHTRRGAHLVRDAATTDVDLLLTEPCHAEQVRPVAESLGLGPDRVLISTRYEDGHAAPAEPADRAIDMVGWATSLDEALGHVDEADAELEPDVDATWVLIFTSGTSSAPKAVICSQRRLLVTGNRLRLALGIGSDDVGYVCMPLFHSNSVMVGFMPALVSGASVGLARRFSASRWLDDVRRYGATWFNYTGKPLSYLLTTPERPDDAHNPLRVAFGNEGSPAVIDAFSRRFGVRVIDAFGATEGGVDVDRTAPLPVGAVGRIGEKVRVVDEEGSELPRARFDSDGRLVNAAECVGEIVNTGGVGPFEGYYGNPDATARATRNGWYWSGDLGYVDDDGCLFFAGRTGDWLRVDGENFPAGPVEDALARHPDVVVAAVYAIPDEAAGDQAMAALRLRPGAVLDPAGFSAWLDAQGDLSPKWRPRYVRLAGDLPTTGTNKVLKRELAHQKLRHDLVGTDVLWVRPPGAAAYRTFTAIDEAELVEQLRVNGRERFWDL